MTALERLKARIPGIGADQDAILEALLLDAQDYILSYCNRDTLPGSMVAAQVKLALLYFNRQGIEGESAHSEGDVSRSIDALPADLIALLNANRLLKAVNRK